MILNHEGFKGSLQVTCMKPWQELEGLVVSRQFIVKVPVQGGLLREEMQTKLRLLKKGFLRVCFSKTSMPHGC